MKQHFLPILFVAAVCLFCALSTGSAVLLMIALLLTLICLTAFVSVFTAARTARVTQELSQEKVNRGEDVSLTLTVSHKGLLPIAPITLTLCDLLGGEEEPVRLRSASGRKQQLRFPFNARHVGALEVGVTKYKVEDVFGLFSLTKTPQTPCAQLLVLPLPFETEDLKFAPGDEGLESMARATEDISSPADVRAYQPGDPLKKIHWKLSVRKGDLLVRRFEQPTLPDALVLLDCSPPPKLNRPEAQAYLKDTLVETAASVVGHQLRGDNPVRLPLLGKRPIEFEKSMGLPFLLDELARLDFSQTDKFERVLLLETRRMRRTGATVVITARLNSNVVDMIVRMRRMGPQVRLYLCTFTPEDPQVLPLISKLQMNSVEVCYVAPCA